MPWFPWASRVRQRRPFLLGPSVVLFAVAAATASAGAQVPSEHAVVETALPQAPSAATGTVAGSVVDADGDIVPGASILLTSTATHKTLDATSDSAGNFVFASVPAGQFSLTVTSRGFAPVSAEGTALPGRSVELGPVKLMVATAEFQVDAVTTRQVAEIELAHEEHQRLFGVIPNFGISYDWQAPAMTTGQKYRLATRLVVDPFSFAAAGIQAGIEQGTGAFSGYGPGWSGFGKRYGAAVGDFVVANELGGAILPSMFHQDPRYFWKGTGTVRSRAWYALTRAVICRGDNGHDQFNISGIGGFLAAGAISNLYYPAENQSDGILTLENAGLGLVAGALGNLVQEFVLKHITPNSAKLPPNANGVAGGALSASARRKGSLRVHAHVSH